MNTNNKKKRRSSLRSIQETQEKLKALTDQAEKKNKKGIDPNEENYAEREGDINNSSIENTVSDEKKSQNVIERAVPEEKESEQIESNNKHSESDGLLSNQQALKDKNKPGSSKKGSRVSTSSSKNNVDPDRPKMKISKLESKKDESSVAIYNEALSNDFISIVNSKTLTGTCKRLMCRIDPKKYATLKKVSLFSPNSVRGMVNEILNNWCKHYKKNIELLVGDNLTQFGSEPIYNEKLKKEFIDIIQPEKWNIKHFEHVPVDDRTSKVLDLISHVTKVSKIMLCYKIVDNWIDEHTRDMETFVKDNIVNFH